MSTPNQIVRKHYSLKRPVTDIEVAAEVANIERKGHGYLDDRDGLLAAALDLPFHFEPIPGALAELKRLNRILAGDA